ncbi:ARABIDOPSIS THALIANA NICOTIANAMINE SYNTHASE 4, nicotianamine synthase 4 [Hibiscus trionum]|uniref:Nicotianamine synthase n=1 Tax=Hibiscus trionum TaxID=183268 RepID=A0A9W7ICN2_HIBTR|nr:ARABIDOPSIS THALIANA NICOTIANAMINE SYNTHASE 4, nicotianamine synthase 4 [Hibiscus trionum]
MASQQNQSTFESETQIPGEILIGRVIQIHDRISKLESLRPSKQVNSLFTHLVNLCTLPSNIDIKALPQDVQHMRGNLILLCGRAEGLLELEFATFLSKIPRPLSNLNLFPYYGNYVELASLEYRILSDNGVVQPKKVAFVGSGPMPLTSFVMATHHMKSTHFDNFDIDEAANDVARRLVASDKEFEKRMKFVTCDIMEVKEKLADYDCIFLAALVGMSKEQKLKIIGHVRKYMKAGGFLLVRSANGARAFLYPVVDEVDLPGFELLSVFHPTNQVINSVVLVRKPIF